MTDVPEPGNFERVASVDDLADNEQKLVLVGGARVLLIRSEGQYFAVQNRCTHDDESLLGGMVRKCTIVCPIHGARFRLRDGRPFGPPAFESLQTYPVRISGEDVEVAVA
jgi:3-phenylpropionate/trans-cinnamate dioxygenase ferredoxin subunit